VKKGLLVWVRFDVRQTWEQKERSIWKHCVAFEAGSAPEIDKVDTILMLSNYFHYDC
jgi:hypothetical protein